MKLTPLALLLALNACASAVPVRDRPVTAAPAVAVLGDLSLAPERAGAGQRVAVTYAPRRREQLAPRLSLRARLRTPEGTEDNDGMGSRTVAVLERAKDGSYRGSFALPAGVVYAALAVEDPQATWSDTRGGRFWEILAHGADGRPSFAALEQKFNDHMPRDQRVALEAARALVAAYPERAQSWSTLAQAEKWVLSEDSVATRAAAHRERVRQLDRALTGVRQVPADEAGHLFAYAENVGEEEIARRWTARISAEHPNHFFAVLQRAIAVVREQKQDAGRLAGLEALWPGAQGVRSRTVLFALGSEAAAAAGDSAAILRWADREAAENLFTRMTAATSLAMLPPVRVEGIRRLRAEIASLDAAPDDERPLGATQAEHRAEMGRWAARLRASLGAALVDGGNREEGARALEEAVAAVWKAEWFRALGDAKLGGVDREGAIRAFAAAAADPEMSGAAGDSLRTRLGLSAAEWRGRVDGARAEMIRRTLLAARPGPRVDARASGRDGASLQLAAVLGDTATVIAVWSPYCPYSRAAMPRVSALAERLGREGVPVIGVSDVSRNAGELYLSKNKLSLPVLYDDNGEVTTTLGSSGTPQFFVLDGDGRLRFARSSLDDLPRQVLALQAERRLFKQQGSHRDTEARR